MRPPVAARLFSRRARNEAAGAQRAMQPAAAEAAGPCQMPADGLPMADRWRLYAHTAASDGDYSSALIELARWAAFRDCFAALNSVASPHDAFGGASYCLVRGAALTGYSVFRDGVAPAWEDPANASGGTLCARGALPAPSLAPAWHLLCVMMCNEELDGATGARIASRRDRRHGLMHKLEVWLPSQ